MRILLCAAALASGAVWPAAAFPNTFDLKPEEGSARLEWVSASTFRLIRTWSPAKATLKPSGAAPVDVSVSEHGSRRDFGTRYLIVRVSEGANRIEVLTATGAPVTELRIRRSGTDVSLEQPALQIEHFYGLGARAGALDVRGTAVSTREPVLISSAGHGEYFAPGGEYRFDVAASEPRTVRITVPGDTLDVSFSYGPTIKGIFEERLATAGPVDVFDRSQLEIRKPGSAAPDPASWATLANRVHALLNASMSGTLIPEFDLTPYAGKGPLLASALQLAALMPVVRAPAGMADLGEQRRRFTPFLLSYTREARDRGFPVMRPLIADFGEDAGVFGRHEEFLLGEELLVAPVLSESGQVKVYLPRGIWTDLATEQTYKGRQEIAFKPAHGVLPMFARNGTIVPLAATTFPDAPLELHYFPSLGAEFFLDEESDPEVSQFHAAPAGDQVRLEIESRVPRVYDWVLHHSAGARTVESGGKPYLRMPDAASLKPGSWTYDRARRQLRIRVRAAAGGDEIVNIAM